MVVNFDFLVSSESNRVPRACVAINSDKEEDTE